MSDKIIVDSAELRDLQENASVANAIKELASILTGRSQDLPHRFRAPKLFAECMQNLDVNQSYHQYLQIPTSNSQFPLSLRITTRPTQKIMEMEFDDACGMRLFTLEIEYGE